MGNEGTFGSKSEKGPFRHAEKEDRALGSRARSQRPARLLHSANQDAGAAAGVEPGRPAPGTEAVVL